MEAYNIAVNMCHNVMNKCDSMTSTERRKRQTIKMVVETTEDALGIVAAALTDALPGGKGGEDEEEGDGEEDK